MPLARNRILNRTEFGLWLPRMSFRGPYSKRPIEHSQRRSVMPTIRR